MEQEDLFIKVRDIINKHDPAGVISDDDNIDEYDSEVKEVVKLLDANHTTETLSEDLRGIFKEYFTEEIAGPASKYNAMADELLKLPESSSN